MQDATGTGQGSASCASEHGGSRVVAECDRCPRELPYECVRDGVYVAHGEYSTTWTEIAVQTGKAPAKLLTLCPDCTKSFRLFMLSSEVRS